MKRKDIKAHVTYDWSDKKRCKFYPGDNAIVKYVNGAERNNLRNRIGDEGKVIAVTVTKDGKIRGKNTFYGRAYTRYFVEFSDGECYGFHSHYLSKLNPPKGNLKLVNRLKELKENKTKLESEIRLMEMAVEFGRMPKEGHHFVRNLMSKKVVELSNGTPNCCDPSTETYWCM